MWFLQGFYAMGKKEQTHINTREQGMSTSYAELMKVAVIGL